MILQAKVLKNVLNQALTGDTKLLFTDVGVLLSQVHSKDFFLKKVCSDAETLLKDHQASKINETSQFISSGSSNMSALDLNLNQNEPLEQITTITKNKLLDTNLDLADSIRGFIAIMAAMWTRYERIKYFVGAPPEQEEFDPEQEYSNDLDVLCVESENLKTVVVPLYEYRILLSGSSDVPLGLLKAKVISH
ncbi:hypothetical protein BB561_001131 [Smittium simulii]|uniref:Uncharacterized protein n=1 Tax=Smittium simulii TaxID=133385 RepID=A0A2T9YW12_9FUNG|nr:hypothetical protein BB561_001131 [Smittium simulii]